MRNFRLATVIILLVSTLVFGGRIDRLGAQNKRKKETPKSKISNLFTDKCAKCHGTDGRGETVEGVTAGAPDFTNSEWQEKADDQKLGLVIENGRSQMPSFRSELNKEQTKSLIAYIRAFRSK